MAHLFFPIKFLTYIVFAEIWLFYLWYDNLWSEINIFGNLISVTTTYCSLVISYTILEIFAI